AERGLELGPLSGEPFEVELHPQEEAATLRVGRVLLGVDDVRAGRGEGRRDGCDDPAAGRAGAEEQRCVAAVPAGAGGRALWSRPSRAFAHALVRSRALSFTTTGPSSISSSSP